METEEIPEAEEVLESDRDHAEAFRYDPITYGPTWERDPETGKYSLPERTLGWEILGWCGEFLRNPREQDQPWRFTNEQARFVLWWYAVDETGRFIYRRGVLQRMKGWGKDPLLAAISLVELCGPSRFSHWDKDGSPVGKPHPAPWVTIAAVSKDQTKNTMRMFPAVMTPKLIAAYGIESGQGFIRTAGGVGNLEAVTSSPETLEGNRATFVLMNETHHWKPGNRGDEMYETIDGNTTKGGNRYLAITNAYLPGEDSVAERMRAAYMDIMEGRAPDLGFLYDSIEAHPKTGLDPESLEWVIPLIRGDSWWINPLDVIASILGNTSIGPQRQRRMWLNQIVADKDALYEEHDWDDLMVAFGSLKAGDVVVMGFDGGRKNDATALVAIRVSDGFVQPIGIWERPAGLEPDEDWIVPYDEVDSAVHAAFAKFKVVAFYADVKMWESYIATWGATYGEKLQVRAVNSGDVTGNPIAWDMRGAMKRVTLAHELLVSEIKAKKLTHGDMDPRNPIGALNRILRRHVLNARRRENNIGVSFGKESRESPKKVDAYAALVLAHAALSDYRQRGKKEPRRSNRAWFL